MPNRNRQLLDIGAGIVTILLAILVYVDSASIKVIADTTLDARFYPKFLAVLMILLSLIMILRAGIQLSRAENSSSGSAKENKHAVVKEILPAAETLLLLGLYVFAIEPVGFLLSTPFYVFGQAWILTPKFQLDIQIQTSKGGFSYKEWLKSKKVLLKTNTGPLLTDNPW
jgi:hypothetical protein